MLRLFALLASPLFTRVAHAVEFPSLRRLRDSSYETTFAFSTSDIRQHASRLGIAQPFRYVAHNGEIKTIVSNRRWLSAKERRIRNDLALGRGLTPGTKRQRLGQLRMDLKSSCCRDFRRKRRCSDGAPAFENDPFFRAMCVQRFRRLLHSEPWDGRQR